MILLSHVTLLIGSSCYSRQKHLETPLLIQTFHLRAACLSCDIAPVLLIIPVSFSQFLHRPLKSKRSWGVFHLVFPVPPIRGS